MSTDTQAPGAWAEECDLVLKGGITSGVVYPLAITELARAFRLRSIGGTSAGAIAAAAAAAAETGRQREQAPPGTLTAGFQRLQALPAYLCETTPDGRGTRLMGFFKPAPRLRAAFDAFLAALGREGTTARVLAVLRGLVGAAGALPWAVLALALLPLLALPARAASLLPAGAIVLLALLLAVAAGLWRTTLLLLAEIPRNGFGVCSGLAEGQDAQSGLALTQWLAGYLDELAGQAAHAPDKPLTFGDLQAAGVDLQVMTTCLTLGRPFRLPLRSDAHVRENNIFYWRRDEFLRLFPARVVDWMEAHQRPPGEAAPPDEDPAFLRLPAPDDLPVVVAVRMSLSFPVLLTAVPLHSVDHRRPAAERGRERVWFTDGGVASNFPIHFFDAPLPGRPTFGIDLGRAEAPAQAGVNFANTNNDARMADWRRFPGEPRAQLAAFLLTAVGVAKDWNHETLSHLPGFRDRIALIRLTARQGGLNLNMPPALIQELTAYGRDAGKRFVRRFGRPDRWPADIAALEPLPVRLDWQNHQVIRLRLLLATMAEFVAQLDAVAARSAGTPGDYQRFLQPGAPDTSYRLEGVNAPAGELPPTQAELARETLQRLRALAALLARAAHQAEVSNMDNRLEKNAPRPTPELKVRPRV